MHSVHEVAGHVSLTAGALRRSLTGKNSLQRVCNSLVPLWSGNILAAGGFAASGCPVAQALHHVL